MILEESLVESPLVQIVWQRLQLIYMVHVVLQYATDVKNMIIKNLRLGFWGRNKNATSLY